MTSEFKSSITSDKVETDNTNFATVKADQTCEEVLIPREESFRQLNWQVTLEKGSVYKPQEDVGIYAQEVDCKYGVQVGADIFGRDRVLLAHGGAAHSAIGDTDETPIVGTRVLGSVVSEGSIKITEPASKADDWEDRPVTIYGDVFGSHITIERPVVVYGSIRAEQTLQIDAPTVVLGEARSEGKLEASDLLALCISARNNLILGRNAVTINPILKSNEGEITIAESVGLLDSETLAKFQTENEIDRISLGPWLFEQDALWEAGVLLPEDIVARNVGIILINRLPHFD